MSNYFTKLNLWDSARFLKYVWPFYKIMYQRVKVHQKLYKTELRRNFNIHISRIIDKKFFLSTMFWNLLKNSPSSRRVHDKNRTRNHTQIYFTSHKICNYDLWNSLGVSQMVIFCDEKKFLVPYRQSHYSLKLAKN